MQTYAARLASFTSAPRKRNQPKSLPSWPHPKTYGVTPATLADAGYYYDPQPAGAPDNVNCIYCENGLEGWEEHDDALDEHCRDITKGPRKGTQCSYAIVKKAIRDYATFGEKACEDPGSERMLQARKETFGKWWTFDSIPGWNPTSDRLAAAGFYNCPTEEHADVCACLYCPAELDGWEAEDDPDYEHRKRAPDCFFYTSQAKATTSKSKGKGRKQAVGASAAITEPEEIVDVPPKAAKGKKKGVKRTTTQESLAEIQPEEVAHENEDEATNLPKPKTSAKGKSTTSRKSKATSAKTTSKEVGELEDDARGILEQPSRDASEAEEPPVKRSTRASRATGTTAPARTTRTAKTRSTVSKAPVEDLQATASQSEVEAESEEHASDPEQAPVPQTKGRRTTKAKVTKAPAADVKDSIEEEITVQPKAKARAKAPARTTTTRKGTKTGSRSRTASIATVEDVSMSETASVADSNVEEEEMTSGADNDNENVPTPKANTSYHSSKASASGAIKPSTKSTSSRSKSKKASTSSIQPSRRVTRARSGSQSSVVSIASSAAPSDDDILESEAEVMSEREDIRRQPQAAQTLKEKQKASRKGKARADESVADSAETSALSTLQDVQEMEESDIAGHPPIHEVEQTAATVAHGIAPSPPVRKLKSLPKRASSPYEQPEGNKAVSTVAPPSTNSSHTSLPKSPSTRLPAVLPTERPIPIKPQPSRSQSALDALLAEPMPTFDSPEKRASLSIADNETPDSSINESENATPEPSSHDTPSLLNFHPRLQLSPLTPEEAQMPLSAWVKLVCDRELDKFQQTGKAYLDAWDRQVAAHRAELLRNIS